MTTKDALKRVKRLESAMGVGEPKYIRVFYAGCPKVITVLEMRNGRHTRTLPKDDPLYQLSDAEKTKYTEQSNLQ